MASMVEEVRDVYRTSRKAEDIFWNVYVARPLAAVLVWFLARLPVTPNQVTFLGVAVFALAAALLALWPGWTGMLLAALMLQASYLLDCADGQLARLKGMSSAVGAHLDFLMDEVKALMLVAAAGLRLWMAEGGVMWLMVALVGVLLVSVATSLTTFVRRPEYAGQEIRPGESARKKPMPPGLVARAVWLVERSASFVVHYPSWFLYVALADGLEGVDGTRLFLTLYLGVYILYVAKTSLAVIWRLAHPRYYRT